MKFDRASTPFFILNYIIYLSSKEVRAKKTIHLPPKEEGVFLEILDKQLFSYILLPTLPTDIRDVVTRLFWQ